MQGIASSSDEYIQFFNLYVNERMIGCAVADSDLEIQRVNNDIFIWDEIQEDYKL